MAKNILKVYAPSVLLTLSPLPERPDYNWANKFLLKARGEMAINARSKP